MSSERSPVSPPRKIWKCSSASPRPGTNGCASSSRSRDVVLEAQRFMRVATLYFVTEVRCPGVSPAGIALRTSSPFR